MTDAGLKLKPPSEQRQKIVEFSGSANSQLPLGSLQGNPQIFTLRMHPYQVTVGLDGFLPVPLPGVHLRHCQGVFVAVRWHVADTFDGLICAGHQLVGEGFGLDDQLIAPYHPQFSARHLLDISRVAVQPFYLDTQGPVF